MLFIALKRLRHKIARRWPTLRATKGSLVKIRSLGDLYKCFQTWSPRRKTVALPSSASETSAIACNSVFVDVVPTLILNSCPSFCSYIRIRPSKLYTCGLGCCFLVIGVEGAAPLVP